MGLSQSYGDDGTVEKKRGQGTAEIEGGVRNERHFGRTFERLTPLHRRAKRECRSIERAQDDVGVRAAHLEPDATSSEIDRRLGRRFWPIGAPDAVDLPARSDEAEGGMKLQCQSRRVLHRDIGNRRRGDGIDIDRVGGNIHQPLEPRHIREIDELATRREGRQEIGEAPAIFGEHRTLRGMAANEFVRRIGEEALVNQPAHCRKSFAQHGGKVAA